jgi:hypothetical protein
VDRELFEGIAIVVFVSLLVFFVLPMTSALAINADNPLHMAVAAIISLAIVMIVPPIRNPLLLCIGVFGPVFLFIGDLSGVSWLILLALIIGSWLFLAWDYERS